MHAGDAHQIGAAAAVELIQVRLVLEEVGIQTAFGNLHVGLHVVGEDLDLQLYALLGQGWFNEFENLRVGHGGGSHTDGFSLGGAGEGGQNGKASEQFFHHQVPCGG